MYVPAMPRAVVLVGLFWVSLAGAAEQTVSKLSVAPEPGKPAVDVVVSRIGSKDGGVVVKLAAKVAGKLQPFVVYQGGGDEDGAGDKDVRGVSASVFELPAGKKGVRVDVTYHAPDKPKQEEQTDTFLVALVPKLRAIAELRTRTGRDRSKVCREVEETQLATDGNDLVGLTSLKLDPALGDDDTPIDKACKSPKGQRKKIYKWVGEQFVDPDAPVAAPPAAKPGNDEED
jgi:hypothetical protein